MFTGLAKVSTILALAFASAVPASARVEGGKVCKSCIVPSSDQERSDLIANAVTLVPAKREGRSLIEGPEQKKQKFAFDQEIRCKFVEPDPTDPPNGKTPKFDCELEIDGKLKDVKVKYENPGRGADGISVERNDGIWGEILSTRLMWALGFPADAVYPVRVVCENCPVRPWAYTVAKLRGLPAAETMPRRDLYVRDAIIEIKYKARGIERIADQGWSWEEFDSVARGELRAERDALALLAAFIQHVDNKPEQQRLVCLEDDGVEGPGARCSKSALMLQDVGFTFGQGHVPVSDALAPDEQKRLKSHYRALGTASLRGFAAAPVWSDKKACVTHVAYYSHTGSPANKRVSEAGRRLLAERLSALTDLDLADLFKVARLEHRREMIEEGGTLRVVTSADWIRAFKAKVREVTEHHCPE